jgi:predicted unusual protein kinase regulating ubiquinone biosynthesis (AarF/ABC1/UbiB family)
MPHTPKDKDGRAVPSRRLSRLAGLGGMAANIAGGIAMNGAKQLASGKRPRVSDLILTPSNALKLTKQLSNMRGAAMKIGQMISMDSGDFLPKELADILARLRSDAQHMPRAQLSKVLKSEWGENWENQFLSFEYRPIAAASIGQVQRAHLENGETLAIKVQYPGVRESVDSDVKNVASLLSMTGLVPASLNVKPIIEEGRQQLHQEADYTREAEYLTRFGALLADDDNFEVPVFYPEFSTDKILAMSYIESKPIEELVIASQQTRDRVVSLLIDLTLRELFEFKVMQTDPNFANYRYNIKTDKLVLLDFGASRDIGDALSSSYKEIMSAALTGNAPASFDVAEHMGLLPLKMPTKTKHAIMDILRLAIEPLSQDAPFDFGNNQIAVEMRDKGMELAGNRDLWHVPPAEMIFVQRKFGGIYMLATRLRASVNIHAAIKKYVV